MMTIQAVADTHTILWYLYSDSRLSTVAKDMIDSVAEDGEQIAISSITMAEVIYLVEKGRIDSLAFEQIIELLEQANATLVEIPFDRTIANIMREIVRVQIPELPDRMIAATALSLGVPVISRDHKIAASTVDTIW